MKVPILTEQPGEFGAQSAVEAVLRGHEPEQSVFLHCYISLRIAHGEHAVVSDIRDILNREHHDAFYLDLTEALRRLKNGDGQPAPADRDISLDDSVEVQNILTVTAIDASQRFIDALPPELDEVELAREAHVAEMEVQDYVAAHIKALITTNGNGNGDGNGKEV